MGPSDSEHALMKEIHEVRKTYYDRLTFLAIAQVTIFSGE
jgi:hypothetical protein